MPTNQTSPEPASAQDAAAAAVPDEKTVEAYKDELAAEWGVYVATGVITVNGVRAFNPGDPVPVSHVKAGVVTADQIQKRD